MNLGMKKAIDYTRVADLYDTYVNTTHDIQFFLNEARKATGEMLELMSGTGRVSMPLIEAGVRLTCVDNSPEMLAIFKKKLKKRRLSAHVYEADVCKLSLDKKFALVIIPFHSFAELVSPLNQRAALVCINKHLADTGRFICTLHNPHARLQSVTGQIRLIGKYPLAESKGTLLLWSLENYDSGNHVVKGIQLYEEYDTKGVMLSKRVLEIQFYLHQKDEFEKLATSAGFKVTALYGDYSYSAFNETRSPFMVWILTK